MRYISNLSYILQWLRRGGCFLAIVLPESKSRGNLASPRLKMDPRGNGRYTVTLRRQQLCDVPQGATLAPEVLFYALRIICQNYFEKDVPEMLNIFNYQVSSHDNFVGKWNFRKHAVIFECKILNMTKETSSIVQHWYMLLFKWKLPRHGRVHE